MLACSIGDSLNGVGCAVWNRWLMPGETRFSCRDWCSVIERPTQGPSKTENPKPRTSSPAQWSHESRGGHGNADPLPNTIEAVPRCLPGEQPMRAFTVAIAAMCSVYRPVAAQALVYSQSSDDLELGCVSPKESIGRPDSAPRARLMTEAHSPADPKTYAEVVDGIGPAKLHVPDRAVPGSSRRCASPNDITRRRGRYVADAFGATKIMAARSRERPKLLR